MNYRTRSWLVAIALSVAVAIGAFAVVLGVSYVIGVDDKYVTPTKQNIAHTWTKTDSLAYANDQLQAQANKQFACLKTLWYNESKWNPKAFNKIKVMGKNAGGIPQLLGLSPLTPPTEQIDRGLSYIVFRYTLPCNALKHYKKVRWY